MYVSAVVQEKTPDALDAKAELMRGTVVYHNYNCVNCTVKYILVYRRPCIYLEQRCYFNGI